METINGFQILRKVAESNTAEIYHVMRLIGAGRGQEYALKALRREVAGNRTERAYLENEHVICSQLDHPNLIRTVELQIVEPRPFLVMELVVGPSIRQVLEKGRPPLGSALSWMAQAAEGLAHLHAQGYVHRDVKPQNILVDQSGLVKVIDFALATKEDRSLCRHLIRRMIERRRPGTWSYMAPEQIRNGRLTAQVDVYSLGVALFRVTTARFPYAAETPQGLMEQHMYSEIPSILPLRPEAPAELDDLVRSMMAKDPLDRPSGMQYVSARLRSIADACRTLV